MAPCDHSTGYQGRDIHILFLCTHYVGLFRTWKNNYAQAVAECRVLMQIDTGKIKRMQTFAGMVVTVSYTDKMRLQVGCDTRQTVEGCKVVGLHHVYQQIRFH